LSNSVGRLYQPVSELRCSLRRAGRCLQARGQAVKVGICTQNSFTSGEAIRCEQGGLARTAPRGICCWALSVCTREGVLAMHSCSGRSCFQTRDVRRDTRGALCVQADQCVRCPPRACVHARVCCFSPIPQGVSTRGRQCNKCMHPWHDSAYAGV